MNEDSLYEDMKRLHGMSREEVDEMIRDLVAPEIEQMQKQENEKAYDRAMKEIESGD